MENFCSQILAANISPAQLHQTISNLNIELVLTAHPTEVNRRTLLKKYNRIASLLAKLDFALPNEEHTIKEELIRLITEIWVIFIQFGGRC